MLRKILAAVVVLGALAGCTDLPLKCAQDSDCGDDGACRSGMCFFDAPPVVEPDSCSPRCAPYQVCTENTAGAFECAERYTELKLLTPASGSAVDGGTVPVQAQLVARPGLEPAYPERLDYRVVRSDGGTASVGTVVATEAGGGMYAAQWTPPAEDGVFEVTAAYPADGGPSAKVQVTVDKTPPALAVVVPAAEPPQADGGFAYTDPGVTSPSWRRDQKVTVVVKSASADVDPSSLGVRVRGFAGGEDVTDLSLAPVTPCDTAFCGAVEVPLWRPGLPAFRGSFSVEVTAKDLLGNEALATGSIPVTRWKWAFNGNAGAIKATPAIGQLGTVYVGTSDSNGKVFALNPEGTKKWEAQLGAVEGSPAVGAYSAGSELVYVGANISGGGALYALDSDGSQLLRCPAGTGVSGPILASLVVTNTKFDGESAPLETAVALGNGDALLSLRPKAATATRQCNSFPVGATSQAGASIISKGTDIYLSHTLGEIRSYQFSGTGWGLKPGFSAPTIGLPVTGLGFSSGNRIVGAAGLASLQSGGVFSFVETDGSGVWKYPDPFAQAAVRNMSVGEGNVVFFGREVTSGTAELTAIDLGATAPLITAPDAGSFLGAPVLGAGGSFYAASSTGSVPGIGEVSAWNAADLTSRWKLSDNVGRAEASPTLDCARNVDGSASPAQVGVLYVPSVDGKLYSFVVDSRGLDTSAPWPKYQHDARNTGNPATPISSCP